MVELESRIYHRGEREYDPILEMQRLFTNLYSIVLKQSATAQLNYVLRKSLAGDKEHYYFSIFGFNDLYIQVSNIFASNLNLHAKESLTLPEYYCPADVLNNHTLRRMFLDNIGDLAPIIEQGDGLELIDKINHSTGKEGKLLWKAEPRFIYAPQQSIAGHVRCTLQMDT